MYAQIDPCGQRDHGASVLLPAERGLNESLMFPAKRHPAKPLWIVPAKLSFSIGNLGRAVGADQFLHGLLRRMSGETR